MRRAAWLLAALLSAGCASSSFSPHDDETIPGDQTRAPDATGLAPLTAFQYESTHAGRRGVGLQLNATQPLDQPLGCVAYRNATAYAPDSCAIEPPVGERAWRLRATWAPGGPVGLRTVIAYDANGTATAAWDGRAQVEHPMVATE